MATVMGPKTVRATAGAASVAVVVPLYQRALSLQESQSLRRTLHVFRGRDRILCCPASWTRRDIATLADGADVRVQRFADEHFHGVAAYNRLLLCSAFYAAFATHSHLLLAQLDSHSFRDELDRFAQADCDYIGAPWFEGFTAPSSDRIVGIGNGGYSLRRVSRFRSMASTLDAWRAGRPGRHPVAPQRRLAALADDAAGMHEDLFWSRHGQALDPCFRVADLKMACAFAFEGRPSLLHRITGRLPMGCHGHGRYEPDFWAAQMLATDGTGTDMDSGQDRGQQSQGTGMGMGMGTERGTGTRTGQQ